MSEPMVSSTSVSRDNLFAGTVFPVVTDKVTLKSGKAYKRGTVLSIITVGGKATTVDSSKSDGSEKPYGILTDDVDATTEDKPAVVYLTGEFNERQLIFGGTDTAATHKSALRALGIFIKKDAKA